MAATKITVNNNGSIRIEGDFEILDPQGAPFGLAGRTTISLCRCGHSANKPFCDGSHKTSGFADTVVARELPPPKPKVSFETGPQIRPKATLQSKPLQSIDYVARLSR